MLPTPVLQLVKDSTSTNIPSTSDLTSDLIQGYKNCPEDYTLEQFINYEKAARQGAYMFNQNNLKLYMKTINQ